MTRALEEKNIALDIEALDTLFNKKDDEKAAQFWSESYVQLRQHVRPDATGCSASCVR